MRIRVCIISFLVLIVSCAKDPSISSVESDVYELKIPKGFPAPIIPPDNPMTKAKIELGKKLFFDPILSRDSTISCGSCHLQELGFTDGLKKSRGVDDLEVLRNVISLTNVAYTSSMFRDGGSTTLELQVLAPLDTPEEHDLPIGDAIKKLNNNKEYRTLFNLVFGQNADAFTLTRSIAAFERTIISGNAKFDQYDINSETNSYSSSEQRGWSLFSGSANCIACHEGFNFTNDLFINNGLYDSYPIDSGRARITLKQEDIGKFKVPTLRNVEVTGPYMFDGSIETLEQVIEHYNSGGSNHPNKDPRIKALNLTVQEKEDLVNFLKTLTDEAFLTNPEFQP